LLAPEGPRRVARGASPWTLAAVCDSSPRGAAAGDEPRRRCRPAGASIRTASSSTRVSRPWLHNAAPPGPRASQCLQMHNPVNARAIISERIGRHLTYRPAVCVSHSRRFAAVFLENVAARNPLPEMATPNARQIRGPPNPPSPHGITTCAFRTLLNLAR
jgi:hypothetical protein